LHVRSAQCDVWLIKNDGKEIKKRCIFKEKKIADYNRRQDCAPIYFGYIPLFTASTANSILFLFNIR